MITAAAEHPASRLARLVYLDAEVPEDGQSEYDLTPDDERTAYEEAVRTKGDRWRIPSPVPERLPDDLPPDVRWTLTRMVRQPVQTFAQPVRLTGAASTVGRTYIFCTEGKIGQAGAGLRRSGANRPRLAIP